MTTRGPRAALALAVSVMLVLGLGLYVRLGPLPAGLLEAGGRRSVQVLDRHGVALYEAAGDDGTRAWWLEADALPPVLVAATIAAEDRRFAFHPGVDPVAIVRASARNLLHRRWAEGGSTITQQVIKLLLTRSGAPQPRTLRVKLREALLALRLEHRLSKPAIMALYLNLAPYGNRVTGANRASEAYFGHEASLLTPARAAFLAALPQRPTSYNPLRDPARARRRQQQVIAQMGRSGALSPADVRAALAEELGVAPQAPPFVAPHFVSRVLAVHGRADGGTIVTSLDAALQAEVAGIVRAARPMLRRYGAHNVAAVVLDNQTGEWLAWEGSGDYDDLVHGGRIDGVVAPRQPGSALKPFTYALAFEEGESPATVLADVPSHFPTAEDGVVYRPRNYDNRFLGPLLARQALAGSQNVPAVVLASSLGVPNVLRFLRTAGFSTLDRTAAHYGLGVTLGDAEVRLDELVAAYAAFARGGTRLEPTLIRREAIPEGARLMTSRTAFWITHILADADARAYVFGRGGSLEFPFEVAVKTGTSQAYHDNWTIGYTRDVTVGVWVGNFDRRPLVGSSGVTGAAPIFHAIMTAAASRARRMLPDATLGATMARPERTSRQVVCALSGLRATEACPRQVEEWVADEDPPRACHWHERTPAGVVVHWPQAYHAWADGQGGLDPGPPGRWPAGGGAEMPRAARLADARASGPAVRVVNPPDGAVYLIDPTLRREFQTLPLRATTPDGSPLEWLVDGRPVGTSDGDAAIDWPLEPGRHVVTARDARGRRATAGILVK